jgi:ABC-type antimicrobial peptide transport system permease subunit
MAYSVSARQREIGIRIAIGARRNSVLAMMLRQGLVPTSAGALAGLLLGFATGRLMAAVFPSHTPSPAIYLLVVPAVFAVAMAALLVPARRAARVDPVIALRQE